MAWEKVKELYPNNDLIDYEQDDEYTVLLHSMARNMQTQTEYITYHKDNTVTRKTLVNALEYPTFYSKSCLNVYGLRMILEQKKWLLRNSDGTRNILSINQEEPQEDKRYNGGFNYTGL